MQVRTSIVILANAAISSADAAHAYKNLKGGGACVATSALRLLKRFALPVCETCRGMVNATWLSERTAACAFVQAAASAVARRLGLRCEQDEVIYVRDTHALRRVKSEALLRSQKGCRSRHRLWLSASSLWVISRQTRRHPLQTHFWQIFVAEVAFVVRTSCLVRVLPGRAFRLLLTHHERAEGYAGGPAAITARRLFSRKDAACRTASFVEFGWNLGQARFTPQRPFYQLSGCRSCILQSGAETSCSGC